jgi:hypothetical protein
MWIVILISLTCLTIMLVGTTIRSRRKTEIDATLSSLQEFDSTQQIIGCGVVSGLAIDETRKKICLITYNDGVLNRIFSYKDILSVELFEDGSSITKTVRSSQIGGAVVGSLVLGGVGAIIGGLSGKSSTSEVIKRIDLRLVINDTNVPLHDINFMNTPCKKSNSIYKDAIKQARHWHGIIEVLIKRADSEERNQQASTQQISLESSSFSVADEIRKLADLHNSGVLSSDEFQKQKNKLLGTGLAVEGAIGCNNLDSNLENETTETIIYESDKIVPFPNVCRKCGFRYEKVVSICPDCIIDLEIA